MVEITYQMVLSTLQTVGILVGIIYYITIMRNTLKAQEEAEKSRQRELILLRSQSYSLEYTRAYAETVGMDDWKTVEEFHRKYGRQANPEAFAKWLYIRSVYNMAGLLLKEKTVDPDLIFQLYAPNAVIGLWERQEPIIREARTRFKHPTYWEPFEFLYNEAKKRYPEISEIADIFPSFVEGTEQ
jgi:hypothetical protein